MQILALCGSLQAESANLTPHTASPFNIKVRSLTMRSFLGEALAAVSPDDLRFVLDNDLRRGRGPADRPW